MTKTYISSTYSDLVEHRQQETAVAHIAIENIRLAKQRELLERRHADLAALDRCLTLVPDLDLVGMAVLILDES